MQEEELEQEEETQSAVRCMRKESLRMKRRWWGKRIRNMKNEDVLENEELKDEEELEV